MRLNSLLPLTALQPLAKWRIGFTSESECNFIGFLASVKNDDLYFKYSGFSFALRYCLYNWQIRDENVFKNY
jgi:hypothetical protein